MDDLDQTILGGSVAAIGIRMVSFYQLLEPHFHLLRGRVDIETERVEGLTFSVADRARLSACLLFSANAFAEQAALIRRGQAERASAAAGRAGVLITAPLGLCFLPAFLCLGLAPAVIGLLGTLHLW